MTGRNGRSGEPESAPGGEEGSDIPIAILTQDRLANCREGLRRTVGHGERIRKVGRVSPRRHGSMQLSEDFPPFAGGRGRFDRMNRINRMPTRCIRGRIHPVDPVHPVQTSDPCSRQPSRTSRVLRTANHSSLRVLKEFLRPSSFEATHFCRPHNDNCHPPSRSRRSQGSEICANRWNLCPNPPLGEAPSEGQFVHRFHRFAQI